MSLLNTIPPESATGEVADIYAQVQSAWGRIPTPLQLRSVSPFLLAHTWSYYSHITQHPTLSMPLTTCIRMLVSQAGNCGYCIDMNSGMLINMAGWTPEQVAATRADFNSSPLSDKEKALLGLVLKVTRDPNGVNAADLQAARDAGWTEGEIFDAVNHGANMVAGDILINAFEVERDF